LKKIKKIILNSEEAWKEAVNTPLQDEEDADL